MVTNNCSKVPVAIHAVGMPGDSPLDLEPVLSKKRRGILKGLILLIARLTKAEDRIHHHLGPLALAIHTRERLAA